MKIEFHHEEKDQAARMPTDTWSSRLTVSANFRADNTEATTD